MNRFLVSVYSFLSAATFFLIFGGGASAEGSCLLPNPESQGILEFFKIECVDGHTRVVMDSVPDGNEGFNVLGVEAVRIEFSALAASRRLFDPIVITDYAYDGSSDSYHETKRQTEAQDRLFSAILENIASRSKRPVVHMRVTAFMSIQDGESEGVYVASLLSDLERNRLGLDREHHDVGDDIVLPYFVLVVGSENIFDAAFGRYDATPNRIQRYLAAQIIAAVEQQNNSLP